MKKLFTAFMSLLLLCGISFRAEGQMVYANYLVSSSTDVQNPGNITDANYTNYGHVSNLLTLLGSTHVQVRFPQQGKAGDAVNIIVSGTSQLLGAGLLQFTTITLYDSTGTQVATTTGNNLLQLDLLVPGTNIYALRYITDISQNYKFKEVKVEFTNLLTANLLNEFRMYGIFLQEACPPVYATSVYAYKSIGGLLDPSHVDNPGNAVDASTSNYATMEVPLDLLGLIPGAYLDLEFSDLARAGDYVGFTIGKNSSLLSLGLIQNIDILLYDESNVLRETRTGFSLVDLKLLAGSTTKYALGFTSLPGNYNIARARIVLGAAIGLLQDLRVYNAFHYAIDRPFVSITPDGPLTFCQGDSVKLTANDPLGATNYQWSTGATTPSITVKTSGTYSVTVTDSISCTRYSIPVEVVVNPIPKPRIVGDTVLCRGENGTLTTSAAFASYQWNTGATTRTINITQAGKYWVTVGSANGCTATDTVNVVTHSLNITPTITPTTCSDDNDGGISLSVTGGSGNYSYLWSTGNTTSSISNLAQGLYTGRVTDNVYGCAYNNAYTVNAATTLSVKSSIVNTSGCGRTDGKISLNVSGGSGNYTYSWSNGAATAMNDSVSAGIYTVLITDNTKGCSIRDTFVISDGGTNPLMVTANVTAPTTCNGTNGSISLTVTGGSGSYNYQWQSGATTAQRNNIGSGNYYVLVTDANTQCSNALMVQVPGGSLQVNGQVTSATCEQSDGAITTTVSGGNGGYTYLWSNGATTSSISSLQAGTYIVSVQDNSGCTGSKTFVVGETGGPAATLQITHPGCNSTTNGSITVTASGANNVYQWSNGSTSKNQTNLTAGHYTLTITDTVSGCMSVYAADLVTRLPLHITATPKPNTSCGSPNGSITTAVTGGVAPYTYNWSNGAHTQNITSLSAGIYILNVSDAAGCSSTVTVPVSIDSNSLLNVTVVSTTPTTCANTADGSAVIQVTGGVAPFTYKWSNGTTAQNLSNVLPGTYTVTVTDDAGCSYQLPVIITSSSLLAVNVDSTTSAGCSGNESGAVYITASGGPLPYTFSWSNGATTEDIVNVAPGSYTVTVTDNNGCMISATATISVISNPLNAGVDSITNVACDDPNSGEIYVTVSGGKMPYNYLWSNTQTTEDLTQLPAGTYTLTVTDGYGCQATATATVNPTAAPLIAATVKDEQCFGQNNGSIDVTVSGGSGSYQYSWNTGSSATSLTDLAPGLYVLTVEDMITKCVQTDSFIINAATAITIDSTITMVGCINDNDGSIAVMVSGGATPYTYAWSNGGTSDMISNLTEGTYTLTLTDANECVIEKSYTVNKTNCDYTIIVFDAVTPNGDGINDTWIIQGIEYYPNNTVKVFDKWGDMVFEAKNYANDWEGTRSNGDALPDGTYFYIIKLNEANRQGGQNEFTGSLLLQR